MPHADVRDRDIPALRFRSLVPIGCDALRCDLCTVRCTNEWAYRIGHRILTRPDSDAVCSMYRIYRMTPSLSRYSGLRSSASQSIWGLPVSLEHCSESEERMLMIKMKSPIGCVSVTWSCASPSQVVRDGRRPGCTTRRRPGCYHAARAAARWRWGAAVARCPRRCARGPRPRSLPPNSGASGSAGAGAGAGVTSRAHPILRDRRRRRLRAVLWALLAERLYECCQATQLLG